MASKVKRKAIRRPPVEVGKELGTVSAGIEKQKIRVTVPAKVAFNLNSFQKSVASLAEALGCRACLSGSDCTFQFSDFVIDPRTARVNAFR